MAYNANRQVKEYQKSHRRRSAWKKVLGVLGCVVVFCTTYALILPALTEERTAYCGVEEHTHDADACYEPQLICTLEEGHVHGDACYETQQVLVCGLEESLGHAHDDSCYDGEGNLICGLAEGEGGHAHTDDCYEAQRTLICVQEEHHAHGESCYEQVLVCTQEEHTHSLSCFSNPEADVETAEVWEATFADVERTGNYAEDLIAVAGTQIGYQESAGNYIVLADGETVKGYTRYGAWYGMPYEDWCAMFVSFCLNYAGVPGDVFPRSSGCDTWIAALEEKGLYLTAAEWEGGPHEGDLVFFDWDGDGSSDHVGIVTEVSGDKLTTIEGNSGNQVAGKEYSLENETILGFGRMPQEDKVLTAEGADYTVTVRYTEEAQLPADTRLEVREILPGTEEYESYASQAAAAMGEEEGQTNRRFFDITLLSGETEVEPAVPVNVTISLAQTQPTGEDTVVHFPQEGEVELIPATADADGVHYEQPGFSTVGVTANSFPATTYSQTAGLGDSFTYSRTIRVGDTVTITVENGGSNFSWGTSVITPNDGYVSASTSGRTLTISGLQNSGGNTVKIVLNYTYRSNKNNRSGTITVNLTIVDADEVIITTNRYNHLDVNVDADFVIYVYDTNGNVQVVNPSNVKIASLDAVVYHTRPVAYDDSEQQSGEEYDSVAAEWAEMEQLLGGEIQTGYYAQPTGQNQSYTWNQSATGTISKWVYTNTTIDGSTDSNKYNTSYIHSAIHSYNASDTFDDQTVASYGLIFEPNISYDSATSTYQFMSEGRVANSIHGNRWPLAIYDGDTVRLTAEISYDYNGSTYTAEYEVVTVIDQSLNVCTTNKDNQAQRGFDLTVYVEDVVEMAPTYVEKVDQYGNPISGATLAVYPTNSDYEYYYYSDEAGTQQVMSGDNKVAISLTAAGVTVTKIDETTGVITFTMGGATYYIVPKDTGTTDNGRYTWVYDESQGTLAGVTMTMTGLQDLIGSPYFIMREIKVPDGYRTVSDEIKLQFKQAGTEALSTVMVCNNPYESGVWAGANAHVEAPQTLYKADATAADRAIDYYSIDGSGNLTTNGTLFAVVLKRNGERLDNLDSWYPLYGSDTAGYTVEATNDLAAVIDAAQKSQAYGSTVFEKGTSGMNVIANLYNLPADITRYYTYLLDSSGDYQTFLDTYSSKTDPQYVVAYYWSSEEKNADGTVNWETITPDNTYRVISHSGIDNLVTTENDFSIQWGTTIEVPNMENRLYFQKRDQALSTSADTGLIDNAVFALYPAVSAAQAGVENSNLCYYLGEERDSESVAYIIPYTQTMEKYGQAAVFVKDTNGAVTYVGDGDYSFNTAGITIDQYGAVSDGTGEIGLMTVEIKNGDTTTYYDVHPATNADGTPLVSATHDTCPTISEKGTGHFNKLKTGNYLLREIAAPDGYALNPTDIPVVVNEIGVYANAGTETDGVSVGNGIGYLSKTLDVFASLNHIDETLAWVYGALLRSDATGFTAFENVVHDVIHVDPQDTSPTGWYFAEHLENDLAAYGTGNTTERSKAMVSYFEYNGSLTNQGKNPIFDYTPNDDTGGQAERTEAMLSKASVKVPTQAGQTLANGTLLNRLWTKTGWSDMAIYQDYAYGNVKNPTTTAYTDLTGYGNISNLFSSSTFVTVTDQPIINEAQVDVAVNKIAQDTNGPLAGAEFQLYKQDGETRLYYKYTAEVPAVVDETTGDVITPAVPAKTEWVTQESATILTSDENGLTGTIYNLPNGTYYLVETVAPVGYNLLTEPIVIAVYIAQGTSENAVVKVDITYGEQTYTYDSSATPTETANYGTSNFSVTSSVTTVSKTGADATAGFLGVYRYTLTVPNSTGYELPSTGGMGTTLYTWAGIALLLCGAALCLVYKHAKSRGKEDNS